MDEDEDKAKYEELEAIFQRFNAREGLPPRIWYKLDENHNVVACSFYESSMLLDDIEARRVAETKRGPYIISTVFLALDHNCFGHEPVLFETMIYSIKDSAEDTFFDHQFRYRTWAEASDGHEVIVKLVEEGILP